MAAHSSTRSVDVLSDRSSTATDPAPAAEVVYCFSILAAAEPGVMPRVLGLFAKRGLMPSRWHSDVSGARGPAGARHLANDAPVDGPAVTTRNYTPRRLHQA